MALNLHVLCPEERSLQSANISFGYSLCPKSFNTRGTEIRTVTSDIVPFVLCDFSSAFSVFSACFPLIDGQYQRHSWHVLLFSFLLFLPFSEGCFPVLLFSFSDRYVAFLIEGNERNSFCLVTAKKAKKTKAKQNAYINEFWVVKQKRNKYSFPGHSSLSPGCMRKWFINESSEMKSLK